VQTFEKISFEFHVPSLAKPQMVLIIFGTSVGPSQIKILCTSYYQNISFRNTVLSQKFEANFFLLLISCWNFAIRNKLQKSSEI